MKIMTVVGVFDMENKTAKEDPPCVIYSLANEINNNIVAVTILAILFIISMIALILVFIKPFIAHRIARC